MDPVEFDRFADAYHAQHSKNIAITGESPEYFSEYKIRELRSLVDRAGITASSIIDFGSGIGNSIQHFRSYFSESRLTCADVSPRSMALSRSRFPGNEQYLLIDAESIPSSDNVFDVTFSSCVFHHIPHEKHAGWMRELWRITKTGGMIVIFEHNPFNPLTVHAVRTCPFDENARLIKAMDLVRSLESAQWRSAEVDYHVFFPRILSALRPLEKRLRWLPLGAQYSVSAHKK